MNSSFEQIVSVTDRFAPLFMPKTIAVAGVSGKTIKQGNTFIRRLRESGFQGTIYPIHPSERRLEGLVAYPSLGDTPEIIDYAFVAITAERVPDLLLSARGRVCYAQVMSSGFDESADGQNLSQALVDAARRGGMRLLGPNCMGTYSSRGRVSFIDGGIDTAGSIGVMSQSGGLSMDILRHGRSRGLHFSSLVSLGNCVDIGPNDLLEYFISDPNTHIIGAYIENVRDGRRFFELLRAANASKPFVILKGGRTSQGQRAAASHTGSLASDDHIWGALAKQTGSILVDSLEQFIDILAAFQACIPCAVIPSGRILLFGNGGGAGVLAADCLARFGLDVAPLQAATAEAIAHLHLPAGASVANPIDVPANILQREHGAWAQRILETICANESPETILIHLNLPVILGYRHVDMLDDLIETILRVKRQIGTRSHILLVLRSTGEPEIEARKRARVLQVMKVGIPVFDGLADAAYAAAALHAYACFRHVRRG